jgi:20S proteasome subunit alpha 3
LTQSRRYDARTNTFDKEGRIKQIEYAMDAIKNSGPALGILCADGVVLATEKQVTSVLLEKTIQSEKIYQVDSHIYCVASGLTADSNMLIDYAREVGQEFRKTFRNPMQVEQLVMRVSDLKQSYTQYGGMRPFGTSFIFAGYDSRNKFQLFTTDPAGNYLKWKAIAHG